MIFVTVGSMFPFDRLVGAADAWAAAHPGAEVFAQIGKGAAPRHMRWLRRMDQDAFVETVRRAELVVAHAGMGSVITAGRFGKPIVLMPRLRARREHNTDHQVATVNWLRGRPGVYVVDGAEDFAACIVAAQAAYPEAIPPIETAAPPEFLARIRAYLSE